MDRLRELIIGDAGDMFSAELLDAYADPTTVLKRLDEFYGIKGDAVKSIIEKLHNAKKVERPNDREQLKSLYMLIKQFVLQCCTYGQTQEINSQSTLFIIEQKLHPDHVKTWRPWARDRSMVESIDAIVAFLEQKIRDLNFTQQKAPKASTVTGIHATDVNGGRALPGTSGNSKPNDRSPSNNDQNDRRKARRKARYDSIMCFKCPDKNHPFFRCPIMIKASLNERIKIVDELHVCARCLSSINHSAPDCPSKLIRCYVTDCQMKRKHPLLHGHSNDEIKKLTTIGVTNIMNMQCEKSHYQMVLGKVRGRNGIEFPVTIMLDSGAGVSLATKSLLERAKYEIKETSTLTMKWTADVTITDEEAIKFDLIFIPHGSTNDIVIKDVIAIHDTHLNLPLQAQNGPIFKKKYPHLDKVPVSSYNLQRPQVLIGLSHAQLLAPERIIVDKNDPAIVAGKTALGWSVYGRYNCHELTNDHEITTNFLCEKCDSAEMSNETLYDHIRFYNSIESIGISHSDASLLSENDKRANEQIKDTLKFDKEKGRYEIGFLWNNKDSTMPDNYENAVNRLKSTESRLKKLGMTKFASEQFQQQINDGWLVEVQKEEADQFPRRNYVYGFITFNNNKVPPKARWVNDTATKFKGVSLNSMLMKGPDNLIAIQQAMFAFREGAIAFQSDVKQMFNQCVLKYEDQFSQLCLWRDCNNAEKPKIYRQTRIIFGPKCAPALTCAIRIHHAQKHATEYPEACDVSLYQTYVDDVTDSRDDVSSAAKVANDLIELHNKMNWPLVEFYSNSPEFIKTIPHKNVGKKLVEIGDATDDELISKMLGLFWRPKTDVYVFRLNDTSSLSKILAESYTPSKREMLGLIMRIYDPLGHLIPFRMRAFIIMQKVWRAGTDWKQKPPKELADEFRKWAKDFEQVTKLEIQRCYAPEWKLSECTLNLHILVDASTEGCCAVAYIRIQHGDEVKIRLIMAKGRVAPIKYMSIPKLELTACTIGARLLRSVIQWHRRLKFENYCCWTDSLTCYRWIRSHHLPKTPFTAPKITEIQDITSADRWRYVPTKLNTSDYGTKAREMNYADGSHEFYIGPNFLYQDEAKWPKQPEIKDTDDDFETITVATTANSPNWQTGVINGVSPSVRNQWVKYVKIVALAIRFIYGPRAVTAEKVIGREEFIKAENYIFRSVQKEFFAEEYNRLENGRALPKNNKLATLCVFWCEDTKLMRVRTRYSSLHARETRSPPILPNQHEVSDAIALYYHEANMHVNDSAIRAAIRARVWIINCRRLVTRIRARCLYCINERAERAKVPPFADLPDFRLDIHNKPFFHTGVDFFGPFIVYVRNSRQKKTIQVVIFTCMVTRAVYLETLDNLSTESFICALHKLWTRRGPIAHIYSDNAKTFHAANKIFNDERVQDEFSHKITFHFIPAFTPSFGGAWERLIKDIKRSLDGTLAKQVVPEIVFETAIVQIEQNMNDRPLTDIPLHPDDLEPLTPYKLINGFGNHSIYDENIDCRLPEATNAERIRFFKQIKDVVQSFRSRFIREYGPIITKRHPASENAKYQLKQNDFVIYMDKTKPPSQWQKGFVTNTYPGPDGKVRVVDIQLKGGEVIERRSCHLLAKIDIQFEDSRAEQNKYENPATNSNHISPHSPNSISPQQFQQQQNYSIENLDEISENNHTNTMSKTPRTFNDDLEVNDAAGGIIFEPELTAEETNYFKMNATKRTVAIENIPPELGASELFQSFIFYGEITGICSSTWSERNSFRAFITFRTESQAKKALKYSESTAIAIDNKAHRISIKPLRREFNPERSCYKIKTMLAFLRSKTTNANHMVLIHTNGQARNNSVHDILPLFGDSTGTIFRLKKEFRWDTEVMEIDARHQKSSINKKPFSLKANSNVAQSTRRRLNTNNINLIDIANEDPADARHIINRRRELFETVASVIHRRQ
jgi:hypothetical protein